MQWLWHIWQSSYFRYIRTQVWFQSSEIFSISLVRKDINKEKETRKGGPRLKQIKHKKNKISCTSKTPPKLLPCVSIKLSVFITGNNFATRKYLISILVLCEIERGWLKAALEVGFKICFACVSRRWKILCLPNFQFVWHGKLSLDKIAAAAGGNNNFMKR